MLSVLDPFRFVLIAVAGWMNQRQLQMIDYLREIGRPFLVVGTKSDRISNNTLSKSIVALKRDHQIDEVLPISVKDQRGIKQLWSSILATTEAKDL